METECREDASAVFKYRPHVHNLGQNTTAKKLLQFGKWLKKIGDEEEMDNIKGFQ